MSEQQRLPPSPMPPPPYRTFLLPPLGRLRRTEEDHHTPSYNRTRGPVVDLTMDSPPSVDLSSPAHPRPWSQPGERSPKRRRTEPTTRISPEPRVSPEDEIFNVQSFSPQTLFPAPSRSRTEQVDLTGVDDDAGLRKLQDEQRSRKDNFQRQQDKQLTDAIKRKREEGKRLNRMSAIQCVVCMENMTNMTSTYCGHLFCHTCLMEALIAGENQDSEPGKGPSRCPICRKKVMRNKPGGKDHGHVIPLELKLRTKSEVAKGKERAKD